MIVYLAADLIWATKIKSTADALGVPCRPVRSVEMLEARLGETPVTAALLDLESPAVWDLLNRLRTDQVDPAAPDIEIICFGPHVEVEAMQRARQEGAQQVLPRGAFDRALPRLLEELGTPS